MRDQNSTVVITGPTTAGTSYTTAIDLRAPSGPGNLTGRGQIFLQTAAVGGLSDSKNVTFTLQDSADNSSYSDISGVGTHVITGTGGTGGPAASVTRDIPAGIRRYVRWKMVVDGTPGTISAWTSYWGFQTGSTPGV